VEHARVTDPKRSGWLYQQLLKLHADRVTDRQKVLVLGASTIFVRPKIFCYGNKDILDHSDEWHEPYFAMYERMMGTRARAHASFVCHYMLFDRDKLRQLRTEVEQLHRKPFDEVVFDLLDRREGSGFSEFETYGNYVLTRWPDSVKREYWFNRRC